MHPYLTDEQMQAISTALSAAIIGQEVAVAGR
jgi:hypothetical protein